LSASRIGDFLILSGEFIAFLDADDLWTPNKLEAQLAALQDNPNAAVAYSWTDFIDETSQFLRPGPHFTISGDVYAELLRGNFLANGSNPLIRRQALIKVGSFDESLPASRRLGYLSTLSCSLSLHSCAVSSDSISSIY
jgi:GT2 family glycosyltransferase